MTLKEDNNFITERAWIRLYNRLEREGLIPEGKNPSGPTMYLRLLKHMAIAAAICIGIFAGWKISTSHISNAEMVTLMNEGRDANLVTVLNDGSIVYLSSDASLSYPKRFGEDKRTVFLKGDAFFDVQKKTECPFIIETEMAIVEVLGTSFNIVDKDSENFSLSVKNGKVKVTSKQDDGTVFVDAGETLSLTSDCFEKMTTRKDIKMDKYFNRIHFKDEPLVSIVRVINRNLTGVKLDVSPGLENRLLTMTFVDDSPDIAAQLICKALNLKYEYRESKKTILISNCD